MPVRQRLGYGREFFDRLRVPLDVFLEIHVDEIGRQRADLIDARILRPADPGPIDSVGAGDSSSAAMACALASGAKLLEAAAFGNLIASITIQQIGVTGAATPEQVRRRWREVK